MSAIRVRQGLLRRRFSGLHACHAPRSLPKWILTATLLISAIGCGGHDSKVSGPQFVGFNYLDEDLAGNWNVTLIGQGPAQGVVVVLSVDVDAQAQVTGGLDSRGIDVTGGNIRLVDRFFGELEFTFEFEDGSFVSGQGFLKPGAVGITGGFFSSILLGGEIAASRTFGTSTFSAISAAGGYEVALIDADNGDLRSGEFAIDLEGLFLHASLSGVPVDSGDFLLVKSDTGLVQWDVFLPDGEIVVSVGFISLDTGVIAGNYFTVTPQGSGLSLLTPVE